jgi:uncharacterized protein
MAEFAILIPSSEGKLSGGNPFAPDMFDYRTSNTFNYFSELNSERRRLINALQETIRNSERADLEKLFGVKDDTLDEAIEADLNVLGSPLMAAIDRYSPGVMYDAMQFQELPTGAQRRLLENGVIFSGLFGLLRPDDLIPNYRLKMGASLPEIGRLSQYWKPSLSQALNRALEGRFVWNLLPGIHAEAWTDEHTYEAMIEVQFVKEQGGERKALTHGVKPLRGALVNFIVRDPAESVEALREWEAPGGFRFDEQASSFDEESRTGVAVMVSKE